MSNWKHIQSLRPRKTFYRAIVEFFDPLKKKKTKTYKGFSSIVLILDFGLDVFIFLIALSIFILLTS